MFKKFDKKKFWLINRFNILLVVLLLLISIIPYVYSRYESGIVADAKVDIAIYLLKEGYQYIDIKLPEILPRNTAYTYTFSISNNDGTKRTDTSLKYDLSLVATTNLPFEYDIYENGGGSVINSDSIEADDDGTYFRTIAIPTRNFGITTNEVNTYTLVVNFPAINSDYNFQGMVESIRIVIDSKQILSTDT